MDDDKEDEPLPLMASPEMARTVVTIAKQTRAANAERKPTTKARNSDCSRRFHVIYFCPNEMSLPTLFSQIGPSIVYLRAN